MRKPAYSILTMTGPNRLLSLIGSIHITEFNPLTVFADDSIEIYGDWLTKLLDYYGFIFQEDRPRLLDYFDRVVQFPIGDSYGAFPDTSGYDTPKDWENYETDAEDPALLNHMSKGVDAVYEHITPKAKRYERDFDDVEDFMSSHKFGGPVFICTGFVMIGEKSESNIIQVPRGTTAEKLKKQNDLENFIVDQGIVTLH